MKMVILITLNILLLSAIGFLACKQYGCGEKNGIVTTGKNWESKRFGNTYIVSIKNRSELVEALTDFVKAQKITTGYISGLGAVNSATLRFFDPQTKQYVDKTFNGQMEVTNLTGNISTKDGQEYLHLHITLGNDNYNALAGHLLAATLNGAGEFVVETLPGAKTERTFNEEIGLNFYDFNK